jgi:ABC transport system ATP-binding/permease protein
MTILSIEAISKQYGTKPLFADITFGMQAGERLGVIGVNGSGKTSLLRIIAGLEPPDSGRVVVANTLHVAYLPQDPSLPAGATVLEAVFSGGSPTVQLLRAYEQASAALAEHPDDSERLAALNARTAEMDARNGWEAESAAQSILSELGLAAEMHTMVDLLSGGQRKRVAMAQVLVDRPDLLILDEPTNHIDTETIAWLETYLSRAACALLLVTHDRYFLDRLVTRMIELDGGRGTIYEGNYTQFLVRKAEQLERMATAEEARRNLLRKELAWLRRGARARTTKQKAHVERVHALMERTPDAAQAELTIDLQGGRRLGKRVIELNGVTKRFADRTVIKDLDLELRPGDRIGIIGPNGQGKSTLLNMIAERLSPDAGVIVRGATVHLAYYDQQNSGLDERQRVIDYIREAAELVRGRDGALVAASQMLERFLFSGEQQWSVIATLSGGERRRLYLLRQLIEAPNVLLLDEPTNDLDVQTLTILEDYLDDFNGAVVVVSHDRYFLDRVVQRTLVFEGDGKVTEYPGGYSRYAAQRAEQASAKPAQVQPKAKPAAPIEQPEVPRRLSSKERRELEQLEQQISALEQHRAELGAALNTAGDDYARYAELAAHLQTLDASIEACVTRWSELAEIAET